MEVIFHGNSNKSGIYKIYNKLNGRIYIGSSKYFKQRFQQHRTSLINNKHSNKFLQNDFNKCGPEAFVFEVIEQVDGDERFVIEQRHVNKFFDNQDFCYNFKKETIQKERTTYSHKPEETRKKKQEIIKKRMSTKEGREKLLNYFKIGQKSGFRKGKKHTIETKIKMSIAALGKKRSKKTRKKMSIAKKGKTYFLGKKHSIETKNKMKILAKKRPIVAINIKSMEKLVFPSIKEASIKLNRHKSSINNILHERVKNPRNWIFQYA